MLFTFLDDASVTCTYITGLGRGWNPNASLFDGSALIGRYGFLPKYVTALQITDSGLMHVLRRKSRLI